MGEYQVFLEIGFQGRLRQADELLRAAVLVFKQMMEDRGLKATELPTYTETGLIRRDVSGQEISRDVELKLLGTWTSIVVETRAPKVYVIHG